MAEARQAKSAPPVGALSHRAPSPAGEAGGGQAGRSPRDPADAVDYWFRARSERRRAACPCRCLGRAPSATDPAASDACFCQDEAGVSARSIRALGGRLSMKAGPLSSLAVDPSTSCGRERALSCQAPGQVHWCEQGWPMTLDTPAACPARGRNGCHGPRAGRAGGAVLISLSPHRRRGPGVIGAAPVAQFH